MTGSEQPSYLEAIVGAIGEGSSAHSSQLNATDELLTLSHSLDEHAQILKRQVMESVALVRASLEHRHSEEVAMLNAKAAEQDARRVAEIRELREVLAARTETVLKLNSALAHRAECFFTQGTNMRQAEKAHMCFRQWQWWAGQRRYRARSTEHVRERLARHRVERAFSKWRASAARNAADVREETVRLQLSAAAERERNDHALEVTRLHSDAAGLRAQLADEAEHRGQLEERLKIAFMRGVCQLNLEAMQVLKRTDATAATSPLDAKADAAAALQTALLHQQRRETPDTGAELPQVSAIATSSEDRSADALSSPPQGWGSVPPQAPSNTQGPAARRVQVTAVGAEEVVRADKGRAFVRAIPPPDVTQRQTVGISGTRLPREGARSEQQVGRFVASSATATPLANRTPNYGLGGRPSSASRAGRKPLLGSPSPTLR